MNTTVRYYVSFVKQASDVDIWNAVFDLIVTIFRTIPSPPINIPVSLDSTPMTMSTSSIQGSEQTQKTIESAVFYEIRGCTYRNVDGPLKNTSRDGVGAVKHDWKDLRVIGQLKSSKWPFKNILLQLAKYMRDAFTAQYTRRFIHGFFLHGTIIELWVFDRSGCYSSGEFDINKEPAQFIRPIAGYAIMSDEELGLDTFVERDREDRFIAITEDATGQEKRLQLEQDPIVVRRAIVCRGTNCYRSKDSKYVAKFSWVSDKRRPEADLLRLARERGVKGVAELFGHYRITSIEDIREGLTFGKPHNFWNATLDPVSSFSKFQSLLSQSFGYLSGPGTIVDPLKKRKSIYGGGRPSKRSRSNKQSTDQSRRKIEVNSQTISLYTHNNSPFENRIFSCSVVSPAGRALCDFRLIPELLKAFRDAIKAYKSLYIEGNILHRDISENNIIITDPKETNGFTGTLIDADLSKELGSGKSGARHRMEFLAIQVLQLIDPTYRYDLESILYTLLWICARRV
ncbi:MAG: hypothetical protein Q9163_004853 [Psora crenata]